MKVLIVGGTGGTGRALVAQALSRGHEVTALVRNASKLALRHEHLRVVEGDILDPGAVDAAVAGQEAVVSALGHKRFLIPTRILSDGTRHLLEAMRRHGVRRYIGVTALGVGDSWWRMGLYYTLFVTPVILQFYFWDKRRQEALVRASGLDWTIVRPGALTNGKPRGVWRVGPRVGNALWTVRIARPDVAHFVLDQLTGTQHLRATVALAW